MRKLLDRPSLPAVILLNAHQLLNIYPASANHPYLDDSEAFYFDVSTYYGLPSVSMKAAMFHLAKSGVRGFLVRARRGRLPGEG